jgi:DNA helicase HerA-like ATPase
MTDPATLLIGGTSDGRQISSLGRMGNRHGLISGATGTGKTVTLQILAEGYSRMGVPVFLADVKGDLSGLAKAAAPHEKITERIQAIGIEGYQARAYPAVFWDLVGTRGHPVRTTISEMGPLLLANLLELNDIQEGVLYACFRIADDNGLLLLDLKDLRSMLSWVADNAKDLQRDYGNLSTASIAAIQRDLLVLEEQGADHFFGEPALKLEDLMITDFSGNGVIGVLDATQLMQTSPRLYATMLLWLLSELFEQLPEVGDPDKPRLVFFFDEAHLLFDTAPKPLVEKIEQVVRLIRSKGVGVYFISQSPLDIPQDVLGQLGLRIQHALRAFTPKDQKAVRAAAETFRGNPAIDTETTITELGIGEALVSVLDAKGSPTPVERVLVRPPESRIGPLTDEERAEHISRSPMRGRYEQMVDRESAYEVLKAKAEKLAAEQEAARQKAAEEQAAEKARKTSAGSGRGRRQSVTEAFIKSAARSIGNQLGRSVGSKLGRQILRGILGSLTGGRR